MATMYPAHDDILETDPAFVRINHLRRLIHLHSVAYYHTAAPFVSDWQFDRWSQLLVQKQEIFPEFLNIGYRPDLFFNWTGDTGMHLPCDPHILSLIAHLRSYWTKHGGNLNHVNDYRDAG